MQAPADRVAYYGPEECVTLLAVYGNDASVVNAARVSFAKKIDESAPLSDKDQKLIHYLAEHDHNSPFFHPQIKFRLKMPIFVAREWFRHTIGFARNEVSRRYVDDIVECFVPDVPRGRHPSNKQSSIPMDNNIWALSLMHESMTKSTAVYRSLLSNGIAPEVARMVLPQSMMTEFIETASLAAYARLYNLRHSADAQLEIQRYAEQIGKFLDQKFPVSWSCLTKQ